MWLNVRKIRRMSESPSFWTDGRNTGLITSISRCCFIKCSTVECFESTLSYFGDTWGRENLCCSYQPVPTPVASASSGSLSEMVRDGDSRSHLSLPALHKVTRTFRVVLGSSPQWDSRACSISPGEVFSDLNLSHFSRPWQKQLSHREAVWYSGNNTAQRARKLNSCGMSSSVTLYQTFCLQNE